MENANSELKAIAKFKTETNEKAGVVKIIERIIFSQEQIAINKKHFFWNEFNALAQNYEYLFTDLFNIPLQFKI